MPNWVSNYLQITGDKEKITKIVDVLKADESRDKLFETLIGLEPGADYSGENWYDLNVNRFGTKWDTPYDLEDLRITETSIDFGIETAWSPPIQFAVRLCQMYGVSCNVSYSEPGNDFTGITKVNPDGTYVEEDYEYLEGMYKLDMGFWDWITGEFYDWEEDEMTEEDIRNDRLPFVSDEDFAKLMEMFNEYKEENSDETEE